MGHKNKLHKARVAHKGKSESACMAHRKEPLSQGGGRKKFTSAGWVGCFGDRYWG